MLSPEKAKELLGPNALCSVCTQNTEWAYCLDCDAFFDYGHTEDCSNREQLHSTHNFQRYSKEGSTLRGY